MKCTLVVLLVADSLLFRNTSFNNNLAFSVCMLFHCIRMTYWYSSSGQRSAPGNNPWVVAPQYLGPHSCLNFDHTPSCSTGFRSVVYWR